MKQKKWFVLFTALIVVAVFVFVSAGQSQAQYPSPKQAEIAKTAQYVGGDKCKMCHSAIHDKWVNTRHTIKVTKGPAQGAEFQKNIYEWVRRDWDKLDTYMTVDQKDKNTNYVATKKVAWKEVDYVVGQVRKQRYMTYYDGGPVEVWEAKTEDGGISWRLDKSKTSQFPGNKERAGYKLLFIEVKPKDGEINKNYYSEFRSWQERCIACHTTGFDNKAWDKAKADYVAGNRNDLRDIFVADLRISCESCHGPGSEHVKAPGKENIINPTKITDTTARQMVCEQCHTRADKSVHGKTANDLRGYRLGEKYEDYALIIRPAWGKGNRQVSIDGKARRDHQMAMDMHLSATIKGEHSVHASMACFDCHDSHNIGTGKPSKTLKKSAVETCAACHKGKAESVLAVLDGAKGWDKYSFGNWGNEGGRSAPRQHIFNFDSKGRAFGLSPDKYHWALKSGGDAKKDSDWESIWPWEKKGYEAKGRTVFVGTEPWKQ